MSVTTKNEPVVASSAEIRSHFPALERTHAGQPVVYLDGPGGTQVPRQVVEAMTAYLYEHNANTHWEYPTSVETDAAIAAARAAFADFLGSAPDEVAFGANMTTLTFHLARSLGRGWQPGDEVVTTELDHHANIAPWRALERDFGIRVRTARMLPESGQLDWADLERCINARTRLVAVGAASNAIGTISDVRRAADLAHAAGTLAFVDAVHLAAHAPIDVRAMDCDFLACSAYKFYGPHIGVLYGRRALVESLDVPRLDPAPDTSPERLETGTQNHEGIVGAAAAVDFLASLSPGETRRECVRTTLSELHARGVALARRMWDGFGAIERVRLYGPGPDQPRTPTVSFVVDGVPSRDVARRLAESGIFVSNGDFYASTVVDRLGHAEDGLVRVGAACYTTEGEIDRLIEAVARIAR